MGSCVQGLFCNDRFQAVYVDGAGKNGLRLCGALCANMRETTLTFFKVEGTESFHDRKC